jgi:hypothetical protein
VECLLTNNAICGAPKTLEGLWPTDPLPPFFTGSHCVPIVSSAGVPPLKLSTN